MSILDFNELWEKLRSGDESVKIEAKRASEFSASILSTVSAFANEPGLGGGYLVLGVGLKADALFPDYEIVGVPNPDRLQADVATKCRELFSVAIRPQIAVEQHGGKNVVVAYIPEAQLADKPVYIESKGLPRGAFRRIGSTDQHCTEDDIALFYQLRDHRTYDETRIPDTTPGDFDSEAIVEYRRLRARVNPDAQELDYSDEDLLYALNATAQHEGRTSATIAGLMLFGKRMALRRHFPMTRVDYIRVEGREWVPDPEKRYETVEMIDPLMTLISRVVALILDDLPKAFALAEDSIHRKDVPVIPRTVIREAVVNALMHRNYRMRQPVQIIRYANRLEIRNPGHSLVPDDRLGEPGSLTRNEKIAAVLHEVGLAETKGTGIRAMREMMERANLTHPLFESDRGRDQFTVRLLAHHFLSPKDWTWLGRFNDFNLTEDEARGLIVVREIGAIDNAIYRSLSHVDTLTASSHLRRLRDLGLLEQRGKSAGTYYVPTARLLEPESPLTIASPPTTATTTESRGPAVMSNAQSQGLEPLSQGLESLPQGLTEAVQALGQRATLAEAKSVVRLLCAWKPMQAQEIADILGRGKAYVTRTYLGPMVRDEELAYTFPDNPAHPHQAYRATATDDLDDEP